MQDGARARHMRGCLQTCQSSPHWDERAYISIICPKQVPHSPGEHEMLRGFPLNYIIFLNKYICQLEKELELKQYLISIRNDI